MFTWSTSLGLTNDPLLSLSSTCKVINNKVKSQSFMYEPKWPLSMALYTLYYIIHWFNVFGEPIWYDTLFTFIVSYHMIHCNITMCIFYLHISSTNNFNSSVSLIDLTLRILLDFGSAFVVMPPRTGSSAAEFIACRAPSPAIHLLRSPRFCVFVASVFS